MTDRPEIAAASATPPTDSRSPAEIERDIEATRARLASTIDAISDRVKPANVARRTKVSLLSQVREDDGALRSDRVAMLAAAALALVALLVRRRLRRRA